MRLSEIHWEGPSTFDELVTWAITPLKELDRIFDDTIEELGDNERLLFLHYDLRIIGLPSK